MAVIKERLFHPENPSGKQMESEVDAPLPLEDYPTNFHTIVEAVNTVLDGLPKGERQNWIYFMAWQRSGKPVEVLRKSFQGKPSGELSDREMRDRIISIEGLEYADYAFPKVAKKIKELNALRDQEPNQGGKMDNNQEFEEFIPLEQRVLSLMSQGKSYKDLATITGTTTPTISYHVRKLREKGLLPARQIKENK